MQDGPVHIKIREAGVFGNLFLPRAPAQAPFPAILLLAGSAGGVPERWPRALAEEGFATLGLGYFGAEGLPPDLVEIPLEYFHNAIERFLARPEVDQASLQVIGLSRGGELALLLATRNEAIKGVVSVSGSGVIHRSPPRAGPMRSAWSEFGAPLPYIEEGNRSDEPTLWESKDGTPVSPRARNLLNLQDPVAVERSLIPLERLTSPVLLISGGDDHCWPAAPLVEVALERMRRAGNIHLATHHVYPKAGHVISGPFHTHSLTDCYYELDGTTYFHGGTPEANAAASQQAWAQILAFLKR
jgi:dienelactone hydrolase